MVIKETKNPTYERLRKITLISIIMEFIIYTIIGFAGYLSLTKDTPHLFINRPKIDNSKDYLMLVGRLGM